MFLLFCIILSGCTSVSDVFSGARYCYGVEIFNATPNARLRVERFYVYKDFEMSSGFHPLWSGGRCGVSSFFSEPYSKITLNWIIVKGDKSEKKYSKIVAMNIPTQFTRKSGSEISFIFYETEVLVVYEYYISRDITNHTSETKYVLS